MSGPRWPRFGRHAADAGYRAVYALPLKLRTDAVGVLNLFSDASGPLPDNQLRIGQALADVATTSDSARSLST